MMFGQDFMHVFKCINIDKENLLINGFTPICSKIICSKLFQDKQYYYYFYFSGFTANSNSCTANDRNRMIKISSQ